jgi:hypothetical protein
VPDDMPPGSALVFDLVRAYSGEYGVCLRFASMTLDQFRFDEGIEAGIKIIPVLIRVARADASCLLRSSSLLPSRCEAQGFVHEQWDMSASRLYKDPGSSTPLKDPSWTEPRCRRP